MKALYHWISHTKPGRLVTGSLAVLLWLLVWHIAALRLGKPLLLPTPAAVIQRLGELSLSASFWRYSLLSLVRVIAGILSGTAIGIVVAALTATCPPVDVLLRPLITVIKTTPVASFIILALLWLDEGILPVFISFLMVFPVIWANLHTALSSVPTAYRELSQVYRLPLGRRIRRIYAPHALPHFLAACRSSMGLAWKAGIAAEAIARPALSIGRQLMDSKTYLETTDLFVWTTVVILLSLVLEGVASLVFHRLQAHQTLTSTTAKRDGEEDAVC